MARSPRSTKTGRRSPEMSEAQKGLWADPEYRAKMLEARQRSAEDRRDNPHHYSRLHVPNGMHKVEALQARADACAAADTVIKNYEAQGVVPSDDIIVPDSDDEIAKAALREAVTIALSPEATAALRGEATKQTNNDEHHDD